MTLLSDPEENPDNDPQNNDMQTKEGEGIDSNQSWKPKKDIVP